MSGSIARLQRLTAVSAIALLAACAVAGCSAYVGQGNDPVPETAPIAQKSSALATGYWNLQGNSGTSTGNFLGTTDNQPLDIDVNSSPVIHIDPASNGEPNIIGGTSSSTADGPYGVTIGGGDGNVAYDNHSTVGGGNNNVAGNSDGNPDSSSCATVGGGYDNAASGQYATVAGGYSDDAPGQDATVAGGYFNEALAQYSAVLGGADNQATAEGATILGGFDNTASERYSAVLGGYYNTASGGYSTVLGGYGNSASGDISLAAGYFANAKNVGCFVWSDGTATSPVSCWLDNQWLAITTGGAFFYTDASHSTGVYVPNGSGSWHSASSRTLKNNIQPVDTDEILEGVSDMPISSWSYKTQQGVTHVGPMAEDFYAEFKLGSDDKSIATVDASGVALAAIQALDTKVKALQKENKALKKQLAAIDAKLGITP